MRFSLGFVVLFLLFSTPLRAQLNCNESVPYLIHELQGTGDETPFPNRNVRVKGIVVGDYQGQASLRGFFVQEEKEDWDDDPFTSEGIFVYEGFSSVVDVAPGDLVVVQGTITEFQDLTEITDVEITVCATGLVPDTTLLMEWENTTTFAERYEGMLVRFVDTMHITGFLDLPRFGELLLSAGRRQSQYTEQFAPGSEFTNYEEAQNANRLLLDDVRNGSDHRPIYHLANNPELRAGQYTTRLSGVMDEAYGSYRLRPVRPVSFTGNELPRSPIEKEGNLRVATFNLENYFNGSGGNFFNSRGASSLAEFRVQTEKIVAAILDLDADIIGIQEVENDYQLVDQSAVKALVEALNEADQTEAIYAYVEPGNAIGTDVIAVGLIYRSDVVTPIGAPQILDQPAELFLQSATNRAPLAQAFSVGGETVWVASLHLKAKASSNYDSRPGADPLDDDLGDGQSYWNRIRTRGIEATRDWMHSLVDNETEARIIILGDLNAYSQEDPIQTMIAEGYRQAVPQGYTFSFRGFWGKLDHILMSPQLQSEFISGHTLPFNADELSLRGYDSDESAFVTNSPRRSSDHDPVVADFSIGVTTNLPSILWPGLKVQISPNPAYDQALLTLDLHQELPLAIEMVNAQGQVVRQVTAMTWYPAGTHRLAIDLSGMESGWYGIRLVNTMGQLTRKILVH
ncbi:MAG: ExeM/NucH family extracellular endonuclease [Saprospiraceae bacterium]|nr:ExeM/NucH family extracellular endonuclease [Saprospiraceae bacterium]